MPTNKAGGQDPQNIDISTDRGAIESDLPKKAGKEALYPYHLAARALLDHCCKARVKRCGWRFCAMPLCGIRGEGLSLRGGRLGAGIGVEADFRQ